MRRRSAAPFYSSTSSSSRCAHTSSSAITAPALRVCLLTRAAPQNSSGKNLAPNAGPVATGPSVPEPAPLQGYMKKMGEGLFAGWKKARTHTHVNIHTYTYTYTEHTQHKCLRTYHDDQPHYTHTPQHTIQSQKTSFLYRKV